MVVCQIREAAGQSSAAGSACVFIQAGKVLNGGGHSPEQTNRQGTEF